MPDPNRETISATQASALFDASPYVTRWMLFQHFAKGISLDSDGDARMNWGTKLQPLVLAQAAEDLKLEVTPNETYERKGRLGCTRDASINCPDRGMGSLETKCVFDYGVWMRDWDGGKAPPRHYEIQLQVQMLVGNHQWGMIVAWLAGELHYFERKPIPDLWDKLNAEAERFFDDVKNGREPNAFGEPVEWPMMAALFQISPGALVDLREDSKSHGYADDVRAFLKHGADRLFHEKEEKLLKARLLAILTNAGADIGLLPDGIRIEAKRGKRMSYTVAPTTTLSLKAYVPPTLAETMMAG